MDDEDDLFLYGNSASTGQNGDQPSPAKKDDKQASPTKDADKAYSDDDEDEDSESSEDDIEINLHGEVPPKAIPSLESIRTESPSLQQHRSPLPTAGIQSPNSTALSRDSPKPVLPYLAKDGTKILGAQSPVPSLPGRATSPPVIFGTTSAIPPPDVSQPATIDGQSLYELDIDQIPDKPWLKPGAAMSDYFNYGFNEETWKEYVRKAKDIKEEREREKSNPFTIFAKKPLEEAWSLLSQDSKSSMMQVIMSSFGGFCGPMAMPGPMGAMAMQGIANMMPPGMQMAEAFQRGVKRQRPDDNDFGQGPMGRPGDDGPPFGMGGPGPNQQMQQMQMGGPNMPMPMGMFGGDMPPMGMGPNAGGGFPPMGGMGGGGGGDMHGGGPGGSRNRPWPGRGPGGGGGGGSGSNSMPMSGGTALGAGGRGRARGRGGNASGNSSPAVGSTAPTGGGHMVEGRQLERGASPRGSEGSSNSNRRQASPLPTNVPTGPRKRGYKDYRDSDSPSVDHKSDQLDYV